ncbi:MAG: ABC transporter ATP-binding protein [Verrucomicrobia bacterium]|nr:ABC transporter ATP-binding protein [Verrucomicrobiota bacterium]MCH8528749.1 ABC transporter ATP-binding protein [Kiritimatiellia bacterium]
MSEPLVRVHNLTKSFGKLLAVNNVSFEIQKGQVVGFIGENGAGKTTTMRMMVTLEMPDFGHIRINGFDALNDPGEVRRRVGWMPDAYGTYDFMTVFEYLDFFARAYGFEGKEREMRVREVMEFTDLLPLADRPMNKLSKGMGQRLCLGRTLLPDPDLLVLDEPAAGLDPKARIEFKNLVRLLAAEGKTLFISSHILSELEQMCDSLLFISGGAIVHHGSSESLKNRDGQAAIVRVELAEASDKIDEWISLQPGVALLDTDNLGVRLTLENADPQSLHLLLNGLLRDGFKVSGFQRQEIRLEDAFVDILTRGNGGGGV